MVAPNKDTDQKQQEERDLFVKTMMRLEDGELRMCPEAAWQLTKKVITRHHPIRNLPVLAQVYGMDYQNLLSVLNECPESRIFARGVPNLNEWDARQKVLDLVSRQKFTIPDVIEQENSSQEGSDSSSSDGEDAEDVAAQDLAFLIELEQVQPLQQKNAERDLNEFPQWDQENAIAAERRPVAQVQAEPERVVAQQLTNRRAIDILAPPAFKQDPLSRAMLAESESFLVEHGLLQKLVSNSERFEAKAETTKPLLKKGVHQVKSLLNVDALVAR